MIRPKVLAAALTVTSALAVAHPARAQMPAPSYPPQLAPSPTPDADALADAMRRLAASPRDLGALLTAGELSLKVGDASGAAALFKRAEQVDPMNGRVKAGMARILVTQERPGEALRYFDQAVGYGLDPRSFAGDRGLAYDLIGESERAQRDYRLALKAGGADASGDEVRRRYALSLGISGKQLAALEQIEPLTRRNDRGAWRARAFILAMTGDVTGATAIASRMMPGALAQGLGPFFQRLPTLPATDKAFAVHFGEVRPTPQRLADARLTPPLPVLGPDPDLRVQVAAAAPVSALPSRKGRDRRRRAETPPVQVVRVTAPAATPGFGSNGASPTDPIRATVAAAPVRTAVASPPPPLPTPVPRVVAAPVTPTSSGAALPSRPPAATQLASAPAAPTPAPVPAPVPVPTQLAAASTRAPVPTPSAAPSPVAAAPIAPSIAPVPSSVPTPTRTSEDSILTRIVAGLTIPGYELGVGSPPAAETAAAVPTVSAATPPAASSAPAIAAAVPPKPAVPAPRREVATIAPVKPAVVVTTRSTRGRPAAETVAEAEPPASTPRKGARSKAALADASRDDSAPAAGSRGRSGRRSAGRSADDDAKATTTRAGRRTVAAKDDRDPPEDARGTRRRGTDRRALAAKDDDAPAKGKGKGKARKDEDAKAARGEPARIWVQVAGGANESDLPKAWSAVRARTPALKGKQAYSTPLRATNRVVTGPFKTDAEARAFVNQLAKQGVSAFPFTSDKGQKLAKLPPK